jgi:hypothetical protein
MASYQTIGISWDIRQPHFGLRVADHLLSKLRFVSQGLYCLGGRQSTVGGHFSAGGV